MDSSPVAESWERNARDCDANIRKMEYNKSFFEKVFSVVFPCSATWRYYGEIKELLRLSKSDFATTVFSGVAGARNT